MYTVIRIFVPVYSLNKTNNCSCSIWIYNFFIFVIVAVVVDRHNSTSNKHTHPVWDIQFISMIDKQGADEQQEMLVSAASDGQVLRWYLRKGLEANPLVKVKRVASDRFVSNIHLHSKFNLSVRYFLVLSLALRLSKVLSIGSNVTF